MELKNEIIPNSANELNVSISVMHPVTLHSRSVSQCIYHSNITCFTRSFYKKFFDRIKTNSGFGAKIISRNVEVVIEPVAMVGEIGTGNIDTCPDFV